jgi:peptidoglycan/LPS O-acetylase OafA/YrhL
VEKMKNESCRNSSIELLRIIAIILIIFHHFNIHGII